MVRRKLTAWEAKKVKYSIKRHQESVIKRLESEIKTLTDLEKSANEFLVSQVAKTISRSTIGAVVIVSLLTPVLPKIINMQTKELNRYKRKIKWQQTHSK